MMDHSVSTTIAATDTRHRPPNSSFRALEAHCRETWRLPLRRAQQNHACVHTHRSRELGLHAVPGRPSLRRQPHLPRTRIRHASLRHRAPRSRASAGHAVVWCKAARRRGTFRGTHARLPPRRHREGHSASLSSRENRHRRRHLPVAEYGGDSHRSLRWRR